MEIHEHGFTMQQRVCKVFSSHMIRWDEAGDSVFWYNAFAVHISKVKMSASL